jgi:pimeloyl-ACP methyl ester carboxylesterase
MTMPAVQSGSARIACDDTGAGPAVVLLHPNLANRGVWGSTVAALAPHYRVITYDRRGFGATAYEPEPHDPVVDLAAVLDACHVERATLVGNSRGGRVAIDFTLARPDRVSALVLIGAGVRGAPDPSSLTPDLQILSDHMDEAEAAGDLAEVNRLEARVWLDGLSRPEGAVAAPVREAFLEANLQALSAADPGQESEPDDGGAWQRLGEIAVPVLSVVGLHDLSYIVERARQIADIVKDGEFVALPNSAHLPQLDDPGTLNPILLGFLAGTQTA